MDTADTRQNLIQRTTDLAMYIVSAYVRPGDTVIDATCGNGNDTLRLARMLQGDADHESNASEDAGHESNASDDAAPDGRAGNLFAFDVLPEAIERTGALLLQNGLAPSQIHSHHMNIRLVCLGHEHLADYFHCLDPDDRQAALPASAIVFNLGYLPGGDKTATTRTDTTLEAVREALNLLRVNGLLCVTMYSGHPEGASEKRALLHFAEGLDPRQWHVSYISMRNQRNDPPEILLIARKR